MRNAILQHDGESGKPGSGEPANWKMKKLRLSFKPCRITLRPKHDIAYKKIDKNIRESIKREEHSSEPQKLKLRPFITPKDMSFNEAMVKYGYNPDKITSRTLREYMQARLVIGNVQGKQRIGYLLNDSFVEADCEIGYDSNVSNSIIVSGSDIRNSTIQDSVVSKSGIENYNVEGGSIISISRLKNSSPKRRKMQDCDISNCTVNGTDMVNCFFVGKTFDDGYYLNNKPIEKVMMALHRAQWNYLQLLE